MGSCRNTTLLFKILKDTNDKSNIIKNDNKEDPVTIADLKVNDLIIQRINEKYKRYKLGNIK